MSERSQYGEQNDRSDARERHPRGSRHRRPDGARRPLRRGGREQPHADARRRRPDARQPDHLRQPVLPEATRLRARGRGAGGGLPLHRGPPGRAGGQGTHRGGAVVPQQQHRRPAVPREGWPRGLGFATPRAHEGGRPRRSALRLLLRHHRPGPPRAGARGGERDARPPCRDAHQADPGGQGAAGGGGRAAPAHRGHAARRAGAGPGGPARTCISATS